jgi:hypothetical protein
LSYHHRILSLPALQFEYPKPGISRMAETFGLKR